MTYDPSNVNPLVTESDRIEFHLDRIATALEKIAAIEDAMSGVSRCC